jgi:hypothetical protein
MEEKSMKSLASCTPREFLKQTNRIRKAAAEWLTITKIMEIRKALPTIDKGASEDEQRAAVAQQIRRNASAILDSILDSHPDETAELLGLCCFIEPEDLDNHPMSEIIGAVGEMLNCQEIIDFFISLARLGNLDISATAKA